MAQKEERKQGEKKIKKGKKEKRGRKKKGTQNIPAIRVAVLWLVVWISFGFSLPLRFVQSWAMLTLDWEILSMVKERVLVLWLVVWFSFAFSLSRRLVPSWAMLTLVAYKVGRC